MHRHALAAVLLASAALPPMTAQLEASGAAAVLTTYGDIALAMYEDLAAAQRLDQAIDALLASPGEGTMQAARDAWRAARVPYQQTEAFRVRQPGGRRVGRQGERLAARRGADRLRRRLLRRELGREPALPPRRGRQRGAADRPGRGRPRPSSKELLAGELHEALDVEKNVALGLPRDRVPALGPGPQRHGSWGPATASGPDLAQGRVHQRLPRPSAAYLAAATDLLVDDLREIGAAWQPGGRAPRSPRRTATRSGRDPHRPRQPVLRRAGRRADEAGPAPARPGGGARLLLRQHAQLTATRSA